MHNLCVFCIFSIFAQKIIKGRGWNFTWSFDKVMRSKSIRMVFVASIVRHKLCMSYAFFIFFCSKIIFDQKLFSYCWNRFDYPVSIVYLSCCFQNCKFHKQVKISYKPFKYKCPFSIFLGLCPSNHWYNVKM